MSPTFEDFNSVSTKLRALLDSYVERASDKLDEILDHVANELELVASYTVKLKQAESSMKVVRNSSPSIVPISTLPPEILTRIFRFVLDNEPKLLDTTNGPLLSFPEYPETLSHVCFQWRQIAIASHDLWTRIDLVFHHAFGPGFLARAKAHVARAGHFPLDIYMIDSSEEGHTYRSPHGFEGYRFLTSTQTPISTLSLVSYCGLHIKHYSFIWYCLMNCAQQTLQKLVIRDGCDFGGPYCFIEPSDEYHGPGGLQIGLPSQRLEGIWSSTSVLCLVGLYPHWTSQAYHQLVDLRLGSVKMQAPVPVTEAQIINILTASPGLRTFHLHLSVADALAEDASVTPVQLYELESVNLSSSEVNPSQILRFIHPGRKPLQLSVFGQPTNIVEEFLRRSNVTQLRLVAWRTYPLINALCLCPNLQKLVLDVSGKMEEANFQCKPVQGSDNPAAAPIRLQSLCLLRCDGARLVELQKIVERLSVQELTLWNIYPIIYDESQARFAWPFEISPLCPVVNYLLGGRDKHPMDDWDHF